VASAHAPGQHCSKATLPKVALSRATRAWRLAPETKNTHPNLITRLISPPRPRAPRPPPACPCACAPPLPRRTRSTDHRAVHRARRATPTGPRRGWQPRGRADPGHRAAPCTVRTRHARCALGTVTTVSFCTVRARARRRARVSGASGRAASFSRAPLGFCKVCVWRGACAGRVCRVFFKRNYIFATTTKLPFSCFAIFFVSFMGDTAPPSPGPRHGARLVSRPRPRESRGGRRQWWPEPRGAPPLPPD